MFLSTEFFSAFWCEIKPVTQSVYNSQSQGPFLLWLKPKIDLMKASSEIQFWSHLHWPCETGITLLRTDWSISIEKTVLETTHIYSLCLLSVCKFLEKNIQIWHCSSWDAILTRTHVKSTSEEMFFLLKQPLKEKKEVPILLKKGILQPPWVHVQSSRLGYACWSFQLENSS